MQRIAVWNPKGHRVVHKEHIGADELGANGVEIGLYDFGEIFPDPLTGETISPEERLRNLVEQVELADQVGLEVFGLGEHHRPDFPVSSPAVVLAAMAERTERIRLTSAVSVLSSDDPVRVFQDFATLDLLSAGRWPSLVGSPPSSCSWWTSIAMRENAPGMIQPTCRPLLA